jgi:hypothetical protein
LEKNKKMSKDKGNKNKKKAKETNKKKVVSAYKAEGQKKKPALETSIPKSGSKTGGEHNKNK